MTFYPCKAQTMLSEAQDRALTRLSFQAQVSRSVLVRQAICAMIDYEADALAELAAERMRQAAE